MCTIDCRLKKVCTLKDFETPESSKGNNKGKTSTFFLEQQRYATSEEINIKEIIEKKDIVGKCSSGSSTPHLYTDYKTRLQNLLLKHFGCSDDDNANNSNTFESLSSDSEY
ncbi:hypothetical protein SteCoe_16641 [Stentor coeruleus]|uniref:Uncharacterized protein n=1 Tax=Stentor coeruleus TaxID=5963 RepID=A0A1R2C0Y9_9CILI|nr:hypothetical protein SteCoe_16641 [Stentor coeruleus]